MNRIIVIILLLGLIISSDKFEFIEERTRKYKKIKDFYIKVIGVIIFVVLAHIVINNWNEIDWFRGSGGNPQESYSDPY